MASWKRSLPTLTVSVISSSANAGIFEIGQSGQTRNLIVKITWPPVDPNGSSGFACLAGSQEAYALFAILAYSRRYWRRSMKKRTASCLKILFV